MQRRPGPNGTQTLFQQHIISTLPQIYLQSQLHNIISHSQPRRKNIRKLTQQPSPRQNYPPPTKHTTNPEKSNDLQDSPSASINHPASYKSISRGMQHFGETQGVSAPKTPDSRNPNSKPRIELRTPIYWLDVSGCYVISRARIDQLIGTY